LRWDSDPRNETDHKPSFFASVNAKEEVAGVLRRAQLAILNPDQNPETFMRFSDKDCSTYLSTEEFSESRVVIEITGAETEVTFIDLPGLISLVTSSLRSHITNFVGLNKQSSSRAGSFLR